MCSVFTMGYEDNSGDAFDEFRGSMLSVQARGCL